MSKFNRFTQFLLIAMLLVGGVFAQMSPLDMPQNMAWPRGSLNGTGSKVMSYQCGAYCWKSFTPDSILKYVSRAQLDSSNAAYVKGDSGRIAGPFYADTVISPMFADTTFKLAARGTSGTDTASIGCGRVIHSISCTISGVSGTSDSTGFSLDPWPSNWRPAIATPLGGLTVTDNSVARMTGRFTLNSSASPSAFAFADSGGTAAAWTNSGTKAFSTFSIQFRK